jgi:hypothetical protein
MMDEFFGLSSNSLDRLLGSAIVLLETRLQPNPTCFLVHYLGQCAMLRMKYHSKSLCNEMHRNVTFINQGWTICSLSSKSQDETTRFGHRFTRNLTTTKPCTLLFNTLLKAMPHAMDEMSFFISLKWNAYKFYLQSWMNNLWIVIQVTS